MVSEELLFILKQNNRPDFNELIRKKASYEYLYHLSFQRSNIIDWIELKKDMHVLLWNAECGALTGVLLEKAGSVTTVCETQAEAAVLRERYRDRKTLSVYQMDLFSTADSEMFDYIFLIGHVAKYSGLLADFYRLLKKDGSLIVADANRLGLKYFAGDQEEYLGGYFTGVENRYSVENADRCFSMQEYSGLLSNAGFAKQNRYYPYPDHKFMTDLYSDAWLPRSGELNDNRRNFERDRYLLFDERTVFDALLAEGVFPVFSNSFLIEAKKLEKSGKRSVLYVRYSNERRECFQIRTDIVQEDGVKWVYKRALLREGREHVFKMETAFAALSSCYTTENLIFCRCSRTNEGVRFPFVRGTSLYDRIRRALDAKEDFLVWELVREFVRRVLGDGGSRSFEMTDGFREVFGDVTLDKHMDCPLFCDIDLIFSNLYVEDNTGVWNVIDYEWSFDFPIPKAFVIYRALYFSYYQMFQGTHVTFRQLMEAGGISQEMAGVFRVMEEHFQRYIGSGAFPVRSIRHLMGTKTMLLADTSDPEENARFFAGKLRFSIDREEIQDGCVVLSGWALGVSLRKEAFAAHIDIFGKGGVPIDAEITRTKRRDVLDAFLIRQQKEPAVGFDCVFLVPEDGIWQAVFSVGGKKKKYKRS